MGPLRLQLPEVVADEDGSPVMRGRLKVLGPDAAQPADDKAEGPADQKSAAEATHPGSSQAAADEGDGHTAAEEVSAGGRSLHGGLPEDEVISGVLCGQARRLLASQGILSQEMSATWLVGRQEGNADSPASQGGLWDCEQTERQHIVTRLPRRCARRRSCAHGMPYTEPLTLPTMQVHSPLQSCALIQGTR